MRSKPNHPNLNHLSLVKGEAGAIDRIDSDRLMSWLHRLHRLHGPPTSASNTVASSPSTTSDVGVRVDRVELE